MKIASKTAIVTGGASGLGEAVVRMLHQQGANIVILDMASDKGNILKNALGDGTTFRICDVSDENDAKSAVAFTLEAFGKVDIIVNVAGISIPRRLVGKTGPYPLDAWQKVIQVNLIGTFNFMRFGAEAMLKHEPYEDGERGVLINTSSIASFHGEPGQAAYSASKGGINAMMLPVARELGRQGIRCMAIAPGLFNTPIYDTLDPKVLKSLIDKTIFPNRLGKPEEFAHAVQAIIENMMFNGDIIRLDGAVRF